MARLAEDMPFPDIDYGAKNWQAESTREAKAMAKIRAEHDVIQFPVADSCAVYVIASYSPPVLRWVPFCDKWTIPAAHIRGLTAKDLHAGAVKQGGQA